jgi:hypothetical protein
VEKNPKGVGSARKNNYARGKEMILQCCLLAEYDEFDKPEEGHTGVNVGVPPG